MHMLLLPFERRFIIYTLSIVLTVLFAALVWSDPLLLPTLLVPIVVVAGLAFLGTMDLIQTRHAVLRNYPIAAHLRFLLESVRPEMRQYFFEDDKFGMPFSPRRARAGLSARQDAARQAAFRHAVRRLLPTATNGCAIRWRRGRLPTTSSASPWAGRIARSPIRPRCSTSRR